MRSAAAISRLRVWHSERALLKACYEGNRGTAMATDISGWMLSGWRIPALMFGGRGMAVLQLGEDAGCVFPGDGKTVQLTQAAGFQQGHRAARPRGSDGRSGVRRSHRRR